VCVGVGSSWEDQEIAFHEMVVTKKKKKKKGRSQLNSLLLAWLACFAGAHASLRSFFS
jgi:hypothetical protein